MDYLSLCEHAASMMQTQFPGVDIRIIYLCKANALPTISLKALRAAHFGCVCVCRAAEYDSIPSSMRHDWVNTLWIAEDTAVLDASMDAVSSRKVRERARKNQPIDQLVGDVIGNYFRVNRIGQKVRSNRMFCFNPHYSTDEWAREVEKSGKEFASYYKWFCCLTIEIV